jgi:exopolyphosphatase/guanosine-5'-triphosphate,3'-diphosphate pyrophosphatase
MDAYRDKMVGPNSLWRKWRSELPSGPEQDAALLARFRAFVRLLKAEPEHAERVARLSLQLYDGLCSCGIFLSRDTMPRLLLQTAALMHEVGRTKTGKGHHKASARMIAKMNPPLGWADMHLQVAALVARYHRGAIPWLKHKRFSRLSKPTQQLTRELAGVLRVADSLARFRDGAVKDIAVSKTPEVLVVRADGFNPDEPLSEKVSGARHLLEITAGLPCIIRGSTPWRSAKVS